MISREAGEPGELVESDNTRDSSAGDLAILDVALAELERRQRDSIRASYRLQFHAGFGFRDAAKIIPYLSRLGISHVYASPLLRAKAGSTHGYDVCDYGSLNPELGNDADWQAVCAALRQHKIGLVLDIVPNHMSTDATNAWWNDVLENGESSPFAGYFDIDWKAAAPELRGKVLFPILAKQFGEVLEAGEIGVHYQAGAFFVGYGERLIPLDPASVHSLLTWEIDRLRSDASIDPHDLAEFESILAAIEHLPPRASTEQQAIAERRREKEVIKRRLAELTGRQPGIASHIDASLVAINGVAGESASFDALEKLLAQQNYRLCYWRAAADDINYRRFFDVNDLVAMCMERPDVFYEAHRLIFDLLAEGTVSALRIDHVDGLFAPQEYLWRLQWGYLATIMQRVWLQSRSKNKSLDANVSGLEAEREWAIEGPTLLIALCQRLQLPLPAEADLLAVFGKSTEDAAPIHEAGSATSVEASRLLPLTIFVEKILGPHEPLPETWPVAGTTGYDFVPICDRLFIPTDGWRHIVRDYARLTGQSNDFETIKRDCKRLILRVSMASELQMLAHQLNRISEQRRESRDFTLNMQRYALREILACFPVYRIYANSAAVSPRDRQFVSRAIAQAKQFNPAVDASIFDFIERVLLLNHPPGLTDAQRAARERFAGRFQQVTSPVMAKGVEDTAFYVYCPLASLDEVGSGPDAALANITAFHEFNSQRRKQWPGAMLASSTHDSKRNEDVRARIDMLAETPREWHATVREWMRLNRRLVRNVDDQPAPSRNDEYLFYQTLHGIWPSEAPSEAELESLIHRLCDYMQKATLEAKTRTSWLNPNSQYDDALREFIKASLTPSKNNRFLKSLDAWQARCGVFGVLNGISQLVLKMTTVGFADIYQGEEVCDPRLVDPDNRVTPDYARHEAMLNRITAAWQSRAGQMQAARQLASQLGDPALKLYVTAALLRLRARLGNAWKEMDYVPLDASGEKAEHLIAYSREAPAPGDHSVIVLAPRLWLSLAGNKLGSQSWDRATAEAVWQDTTVSGPIHETTFVDIFTGAEHTWSARTRVADLLGEFPVAVLAGGMNRTQDTE